MNRLPRYYRYLRELLSKNILRISSGELSKLMNVTASQIRQDLNCFGGFGQQGYGYNVKYLYNQISEILGVNEDYSAVIIGVGHLGTALACGTTFKNRGVTLKALFDNSSEMIGKQVAGLTVLDVKDIGEYCYEHRVDIAVLCVPGSAAPEVASQLRELSIKGVWNFSGKELNLEDCGVAVQNVHLGDLLMTLCYQVKTSNADKPLY